MSKTNMSFYDPDNNVIYFRQFQGIEYGDLK